MTRKVLLLISSCTTSLEEKSNQDRSKFILDNHKLDYDVLDGGDLNNKDRRNELFGISGIRAVYPQWFIVTSDDDENNDNISFVGDWATVEQFVECDHLDREILEANPGIQTFSQVFADVAKKS